MKYYTYLHRRNDTNAVFYIGKGHDRRAWNKKRNDHWHKIVAKHGYSVEVVAYWPTEQQALDHEIFLIWCFRQLGARLSNQTDGGQGSSGRKRPLVERQAISAKMKEITKGENNPMFGKDPWNKGLKGHPNPGGVRKGQKRPGVGGVKAGNVPWNKGVTGYSTSKKGKTYRSL